MQGQAQLPTMAVPKFSVTTEAHPPIMGAARSIASSEMSKIISYSPVSAAGRSSLPLSIMRFPPNFPFPIRSRCPPPCTAKGNVASSLPRATQNFTNTHRAKSLEAKARDDFLVYTMTRSRPMLALILLLAAALLGEPASAKDKTAGTDANRQDASQSEIRLGMSADFSASARALSIELYRGAMAYLLPLNNAGGVAGRRIVIKAHDDQYEPDLAIRNTQKLMGEDDVFALFSYVGTPTMVLV